jgi:hypothetical protein
MQGSCRVHEVKVGARERHRFREVRVLDPNPGNVDFGNCYQLSKN